MPTEHQQNRMRQHLTEQGDSSDSLFGRCCQVTEDSIRENPALATLTAFGVGLGIGAVVGSLLAEPGHMSRRRTAETLGRRMLDSLADVLPESVRQHIS